MARVPAMTSTDFANPVTESLEMTLHIAHFYPDLLPEVHAATVKQLLKELYTIQPLSLSATPLGPDEQANGIANPSIDELLNKDDISPKWRGALEFKRDL